MRLSAKIVFVSACALAPLVLTPPPRAGAQGARGGGAVPKARRGAAGVRFESGRSALKIPLDIDNSIIRVEVRVNGSRPLKFIFDTGASASAIGSDRAAELGLKTEG